MNIIAESERLYLRKVDKGDVEFLSGLFGDEDVMRFYPGVRDWSSTQAWIDKTTLNYQDSGHGKWMIICKETSKPLGHCGLIKMDIGGKKEVELGYSLAKEYWGRGYATEAAKMAIQLGFERFGYERIISTTDPKNIASISVAEKLGMKWDRTETVSANGSFFKSDVYLLDRSNFKI